MPRIVQVLRIAIPAVAILASVGLYSFELAGKQPGPLSSSTEIRAKNHLLSLTLYAAITSDGKNSFYFDGKPNAPTLRLSPGDQLKITYINDLPAKPKESCAISPCIFTVWRFRHSRRRTM
jgi:hypothetical protein